MDSEKKNYAAPLQLCAAKKITLIPVYNFLCGSESHNLLRKKIIIQPLLI
jgi:hypothetical protein